MEYSICIRTEPISIKKFYSFTIGIIDFKLVEEANCKYHYRYYRNEQYNNFVLIQFQHINALLLSNS